LSVLISLLRFPMKDLRQFGQLARSFEHPNVGGILGLIDGYGPVPHLVLPYFFNGDIIRYLKQNSGKTDGEKIELVRTLS
jgi:hypothetical protein